jgi:hypothetical protein
MVDELTYVCEYCHKHYTRESAYLKHLQTCPTMLRQDEFKSVHGQMSWEYYQAWRRAQHRPVCNITTFFGSKLYNTFIRFARFVSSVQLPLPYKFVNVMVQNSVDPSIWTRTEVYVEYIKNIDDLISPIELTYASAEVLFQYADKYEIPVCETFSYITPSELIRLVELRKLSPWLLLFSSKFASWLVTLGEEQQFLLEQAIKCEDWDKHKQRHRDSIVDIKRIVRELGL